MTQARDASGLWVNAAEAAGNALVHVSAGCRGGATGHLFGAEGLVVTTARAVAGRGTLEVAQGDRETPARVVGYDAATDVAVVRPESSLGEPPTWTNEPLPLGLQLLGATRPGRAVRVRLGMVSQLGGAWRSLRGGRIERYVETNLAPEPGFSGGLAFDSQGRAAGMTSAGLLRGVPLLLEKPTLDRVVAALLKDGRVRRGYLGVGTQAVRLAEQASSTGLLVTSVQPGSPAALAGLLLGDVLLELGGSVLDDWGALQASLEDSEGRVLPLSLLRAGQPLRLDVTPGVRS